MYGILQNCIKSLKCEEIVAQIKVNVSYYSYLWCTDVLLAQKCQSQQVCWIQFTFAVCYTYNNKRVESPTNQNWNRSIAEAIFDLKLNPIARLPTKMEKRGKFRKSSCIIEWKFHPNFYASEIFTVQYETLIKIQSS